MNDAILYSRWSSDPQDKGDSKRRQAEAGADFCAKHKLNIVSSLIDGGMSGFKSIHRTHGKFGVFLKQVERGDIKRGTVFVVEDWDRFGRERSDIALATLVKILEAGIHVGVCTLDMILTADDLEGPKLQWVLGDMIRARESSKRKSRMGKAYQQERRRKEQEGIVTNKRCPKWCKREGDKFVLIPEQASILRKAIAMCIAGHGIGTVKNKLGISKSWAGLSTTLRSKTLIGERHHTEILPDGKRRTTGSIGTIFPPVVDMTTWQRLQAALDSRKHKKGKRGERVTCLFSDLMYDARDGSPLWAKMQNNKTVYLRPKSWYRGEKGSGSLRYDLLEKALLETLYKTTAQALCPETPDMSEIAGLEAEIASLQKNKTETEALFLKAGANVSHLSNVLMMLTTTLAERMASLETLKREFAQKTSSERLSEAKDVIRQLAGLEGDALIDARTRIKSLMVSLIQEIWIKIRSTTMASVQIWFRSGQSISLVLAPFLVGQYSETYEADDGAEITVDLRTIRFSQVATAK